MIEGRERLRRRASRLAVFIVVWDVIEGAVAITAGLAANSIALVGFGIDSGIEVFAASVVLWELRGGTGVGIVLNAVALAVMIPVAALQWRTGRQLGNAVVTAQAKETWLSNALSINVLAGLGVNAAFGWAWADPTVALVVVGFAAHAGIDAWRDAGEAH